MIPDNRVLIAGAGPVGLVAAAALARRNVPVTVLEASASLSEESRASTFHPPTLDMLERQDRLGVVMLGRPYHHDPGLNHGILDEFQKLRYPVFSQNTLPLDEDLLDRLFGPEVRAGVITHPLDISDVWKTATAASSNLKIWAAKFTARHPNLVAVELSSFKCGHDAPVYSVVEHIIERSGTPYFCFKDLDENKPVASIKLRVETIDYFLKSYRDQMARRKCAARQSPEDQDDSECYLPIAGANMDFNDAREKGVQPL